MVYNKNQTGMCKATCIKLNNNKICDAYKKKIITDSFCFSIRVQVLAQDKVLGQKSVKKRVQILRKILGVPHTAGFL
jgi:hypothetical protein